VYIAALLWSMQTAMTVGYGDIVAQTDAERIYMILAMLLGGGFFSFIIGAFVGVLASLYHREAATSAVLDQVNAFIATAELKPALASRLRAYFRHQHTALTELNSWHSLLDVMSPALRGDVAFAVNASWLSGVTLFAEQQQSFLIELSLAFRPLSFPPGEVLMSRGDDATCASLMVITRGVVAFSAPERPSRLHFARRHRTELLGVEALHPGCRVAMSITAVGPVRAQALRMDALMGMTRAFPAFAPHLRRLALRHCLLWRLLDTMRAMRRVRAAVAGADDDAAPQMLELSAIAAGEGLPGGAAGTPDTTLPTAAVMLAVAHAAPLQFQRCSAAALTVQRFWRGSRSRGSTRKTQTRRKRRESMSSILASRVAMQQFNAEHDAPYARSSCYSVDADGGGAGAAAAAAGGSGGGGGGADTRLLLHTMLAEFAAVKTQLQAVQARLDAQQQGQEQVPPAQPLPPRIGGGGHPSRVAAMAQGFATGSPAASPAGGGGVAERRQAFESASPPSAGSRAAGVVQVATGAADAPAPG
jgi:CRP-like cAMP-binding protein